MNNQAKIDEYDLVEVIQVPEEYSGVMDVGDVGVVVEKYYEHNFEVECVQPGSSPKWLEPLHINNIRLKSKDPYHTWVDQASSSSSTSDLYWW